MGDAKLSHEFKRKAMAQITERGHPVTEVSARRQSARAVYLEASAWECCIRRYRQGC